MAELPKPKVEYLVVPPGWNGKSFVGPVASLADAKKTQNYWLNIAKSSAAYRNEEPDLTPHRIIKAITTYEWVEE